MAAWRSTTGPEITLWSDTLPDLSTTICTTTSPSVCACRASGGYCGSTRVMSCGSPMRPPTGTGRLGFTSGVGSELALAAGEVIPASALPGMDGASTLGAAAVTVRVGATGCVFKVPKTLGTLVLPTGAGTGAGAGSGAAAGSLDAYDSLTTGASLAGLATGGGVTSRGA